MYKMGWRSEECAASATKGQRAKECYIREEMRASRSERFCMDTSAGGEKARNKKELVKRASRVKREKRRA